MFHCSFFYFSGCGWIWAVYPGWCCLCAECWCLCCKFRWFPVNLDCLHDFIIRTSFEAQIVKIWLHLIFSFLYWLTHLSVYLGACVLAPTLHCNCDCTLIFLNFVILPLLFTSQHDFAPSQRDFTPSQSENRGKIVLTCE